MAEAVDVEITPIEDTEPETVANYKAPAKKTIQELETLDADDESLVSYKKQLLNVDEGACPDGDPRLVIVESMSFLVDGRDDMVMDLTGMGGNFVRFASPVRTARITIIYTLFRFYIIPWSGKCNGSLYIYIVKTDTSHLLMYSC